MWIESGIGNRLLKKAELLDIVLEDTVENLLSEELNSIDFIDPNKILFSDFCFGFTKTLNACTSFGGIIIFNGAWVENLLLGYNDMDIVRNAFHITLGHEVTHLEYPWKYRMTLRKSDYKFSHWIDEIHADFNAAKLACDSNRERLISACKYKLQKKRKDKSDYTHPSWEERLHYAQNYDFNKELIIKIASDTGCRNKELIENACEYFPDILLK